MKKLIKREKLARKFPDFTKRRSTHQNPEPITLTQLSAYEERVDFDGRRNPTTAGRLGSEKQTLYVNPRLIETTRSNGVLMRRAIYQLCHSAAQYKLT
jgi:hypothetical protein